MNSNSQLQPPRWQPIKAFITGLFFAWGVSQTAPAQAAETLRLKIGPLTQTVQLADLEHFAATGEIPGSLSLYTPLLTPQLKEFLQSRMALDPALSTLVLKEVLQSANGKPVIQVLEKVAPSLSPADLQMAIDRAAASPEGLSFLGVVQAIPQETLDVNVSALLTLVSQLSLGQVENASLGHVLGQELLVPQGTQPQPQPILDPTKSGPESVELWQLTLRDRSRKRSIPVDLYWSHNTRGPLVVISHGFGADRRFFAYLAQHLASYGLAVAAVEHPGSNVAALLASPTTPTTEKTNRLLPATEFLDRPKDISFVLDRLARLNESSFSLRGRLNTHNVTLIGHSLGGYTGLALAGAPLDTRTLKDFCENILPSALSPADWLQCTALDLPSQTFDLSDRRVTQLMVMNPLTGQLFSKEGLNQVKIPTLVLTSSHDGVTPIASQQLRLFDQLAGSKYLVTVIGGTHLSVGDPSNLNPALSRIPFMPELPGTATGQLRDFIQGLSLSFTLQQTPQAEQYKAFLSPEYAQTYSTAVLPIRLSQEIPASVQRWLNLTGQKVHQRNRALDYMPSLLHLEAIEVQHRFRTLQQQMIAYLRTSPPSLTAVYLPTTLFRPNFHATSRQ
ncbi:MAG TPA: alpha/beta fold hydrolase [Trichocoleus sp.]